MGALAVLGLRYRLACNARLHVPSLVLGDVYARGPDGRVRFHPLLPPDHAEVALVARHEALDMHDELGIPHIDVHEDFRRDPD